MTRRYSFINFAAIAIALVGDFVRAAVDVGRQLIATLLEVVALPNEYRFAAPTPDGLSPTDGDPLDAATQHFLRHEANYGHRGATRHT